MADTELKTLFDKLRADSAKHDKGLSVGEVSSQRESATMRDIILSYVKNINKMVNTDVKYYINMYYHDLPIPIPITQFAQSVNISKSMVGGYEQAQLTLKLPADLVYALFMDEAGLPTTGQYVVIKRPADTGRESLPRSFSNEFITEFFGMVISVGQQLSVDQGNGFVGFETVDIHCGCWLSAAQLGQYRTSAYNIPKATIKRVPGISEFMIAGKDWRDFMRSEVISGVKSTNVQKSILGLVKSLMYMRLPESLKSEPNDVSALMYKYMNDVGYDNKSVLAAYLKNSGFPQSEIDAVINGNISEINKIGTVDRAKQGSSDESTITGNTRLGSIIGVATCKEHLPDDSVYRNYLPFEKDQHLFANLSRLETPFFKGGSVWDLIRHTFSPDHAIIEMFPVFIPDMRTKDSSFKPPNSAMTSSLGGTPMIMWRFKPLPPEVIVQKEVLNSISSNTAKILDAIRAPKEFSYTTQAEKNRRFQYPSSPISSATDYGHFIKLDNVISLQTQLNETSRVNATYVENPILDTEDLTFTGGVLSEPQIDAFDALRHGLKMYDMNYPFKDLLKGDSTAVAEYLYLLTTQQQRYYVGEIMIKGDTELINVGTWLTVGDEFAQLEDSIGKTQKEFQDNKRGRAGFGDTTKEENRMKGMDERSKVISDDREQMILNSNAHINRFLRLGSFICYVEEVMKAVQVDPTTGHMTQMMNIRFTRGSWGGFSQTLPPNKVGKIGRI